MSSLVKPPAWRRGLRWGWLAAVFVALTVALSQRRAEVGAQLDLLDPPLLLGAAVLGLLGVGLSGGIWRGLLAGLGVSLGPSVAAEVFFVGQLGKYLPGSVWPVLAQAELAREHEVPARASFAAVGLFLWVHLVTGVAVAAVGLAVGGVVPRPVALLAPLALALLAPRPLGWLLGRALRLARREPLPRIPDIAVMARAAGWAAAMWVAYGAHLAVVLAALGEDASLLVAAGAFAAAWCAGFAVLVAPAGAGVREAVLVTALASAVSPGAGLTVALASRLLLTFADLAWGLAGLAAGQSKR